MRWSEFESEQPRLAKLVADKLAGPGVVLVVTIRRDGQPRLSPVEPLFWRGDLWLSMGWGSRKAADLRRDPRILVHNIVTKRDGSDGECKVRGRAMPESDPNVQAAYADAVARRLGWEPEVGRFHLFWVDVADITVIRWDDTTNDQFIARWPAMIEEVRRGTSATSQGPPEPFEDLVVREGR